MKKSILLKTAIAISAFASSLASLFANGDAVQINVDLTTQRFIGGVSELDRSKFFNVHSNYDARSLTHQDLEQLKQLGVGFGRDFESPFFYFNGEADYPTREQAEAMATYKRNRDQKHPNFEYRTRQLVVTDHPRFVFNPEEDPKEAARWAADFFELYYDDDYRPLYYEPMNEPFVHTNDFGKDDVAIRDKMTQVFAEIGKEFDKRGIDTKVVGYSSAWPSQELKDFWHWDTRMKMFMDEAGDHIDAISVHLYDGLNVVGQSNRRSGSNADAILDLIETYSHIKWGGYKPFALTEFGGIVSKEWPKEYSPKKHSQEVRALNHLLFGFFDRQNRIDIAIPFIATKSPWFWADNEFQPYVADLWRPDLDSIENGIPRKFFPTEKMTFYKLWSEVKGKRIKIASSDPDIYTQAFVDGKDAYLCLNNLEDANRTISLNFASEIQNLDTVHIKRLDARKDEAANYTDETLAKAPSSLKLQAHETLVLKYSFKEEIKFDSSIHSREYYSKTYLQPIEANQLIRFEFNEVETGPGTAQLRMAIGRKHERSKQPIVKVNGKSVTVPSDWPGYDQANRDDFFGSIRIPVPSKFIKKSNTIDIAFPDGGGHLSSLILQIDRETK